MRIIKLDERLHLVALLAINALYISNFHAMVITKPVSEKLYQPIHTSYKVSTVFIEVLLNFAASMANEWSMPQDVYETIQVKLIQDPQQLLNDYGNNDFPAFFTRLNLTQRNYLVKALEAHLLDLFTTLKSRFPSLFEEKNITTVDQLRTLIDNPIFMASNPKYRNDIAILQSQFGKLKRLSKETTTTTENQLLGSWIISQPHAGESAAAAAASSENQNNRVNSFLDSSILKNLPSYAPSIESISALAMKPLSYFSNAALADAETQQKFKHGASWFYKLMYFLSTVTAKQQMFACQLLQLLQSRAWNNELSAEETAAFFAIISTLSIEQKNILSAAITGFLCSTLKMHCNQLFMNSSQMFASNNVNYDHVITTINRAATYNLISIIQQNIGFFALLDKPVRCLYASCLSIDNAVKLSLNPLNFVNEMYYVYGCLQE